MRLVFVDESESKRFYWVAALIAHERAIEPITRAFSEICRTAALKFGVDPDAELHGYELFHAEGDWLPMKEQIRARIGIYAQALNAIGTHDVEIILRGVDKRRLLQRYAYPDDPHAVVLRHVLERVDERVETAYDSEPTLVIADQVTEPERYRRDLERCRLVGTGGYRSRRIRCIVDTIHFVPSRASRMVQAIDMTLFLSRRMSDRAGMDGIADRVNADLWSLVQPRVLHRGQWTP